MKKHLPSITIIALLVVVLFKAVYDLNAKDDRIKELELQVWNLKMDKFTDSVVRHHTEAFRQHLDSMLTHK